MGRVLSFGSVNIDHVYTVEGFVQPGETISSLSYSRYAGGKGFNQSTALARAGAEVFHAGLVGADGEWLREALKSDGADVSFLRTCGMPTGHAIIQVDASGQNCIIVEGGANGAVTAEFAREVLANFGSGDVLLLQNEISSVGEIMRIAAERGIAIAFNPAPMNSKVADYPLELVSLFVVNEIEGAGLSGAPAGDAEAVLELMGDRFPDAGTVLTLGSRGAIAKVDGERVFVPAEEVEPVDTTAAGDTFAGYFLASRMRGDRLESAMRRATHAAALCVSGKGAAPSIPRI